MPNFRNILHRIFQRMGAFIFSWDALIFCFFYLLSTGIWFAYNVNKEGHQTVQQDRSNDRNESVVYTEKTLRVAISCPNTPAGEQLLFFPEKVTITARIPTSAYDRIHEEDFRCECLYPMMGADTLTINAICTSNEVAAFRYEPQVAEYLIQPIY